VQDSKQFGVERRQPRERTPQEFATSPANIPMIRRPPPYRPRAQNSGQPASPTAPRKTNASRIVTKPIWRETPLTQGTKPPGFRRRLAGIPINDAAECAGSTKSQNSRQPAIPPVPREIDASRMITNPCDASRQHLPRRTPPHGRPIQSRRHLVTPSRKHQRTHPRTERKERVPCLPHLNQR
jgi:hypothetical protein